MVKLLNRRPFLFIIIAIPASVSFTNVNPNSYENVISRDVSLNGFSFGLLSSNRKSRSSEISSSVSSSVLEKMSITRNKNRNNNEIELHQTYAPPKMDKVSLGSKLVRNFVESFLGRLAMHSLNLKVSANSVNLPGVLSGKVNEVKCTFDRLAFRNLKISGGGNIIARRVTLNLFSFAPVLAKYIQRFTSPFELHAHNCVLVQDDVMNSSCIRNGLQSLLNRILKKALLSLSVSDFLLALKVENVQVLETNKISCSGTGITLLGAPFPFEVRTGLELSNLGSVIEFPGIELVVNPGPLQIVFPFDQFDHNVNLDIGHNAKIEHLFIDGRRRQFHFSGRATITPKRIDHIAQYRSADDIISAKFSCDLGRWVTRVLGFKNIEKAKVSA